MPGLPTGTVTFLFTDIEGSTPLWESLPEAMKVALEQHDSILHQAIAENGGQTFKLIGDAFEAAFVIPAQAVEAAIAAQRALAAAAWGETGPIKVRMGIHTGPAEVHGSEYSGHTLNRVARIMAAGHGGQILLSAPAADLARGDLPKDVSYKDLGQHYLKGLNQPEHLFQILAPGLPESFPPLVTRIVPRGYQLLEQIGEGGFGAVYRAFHPDVGREVAIKIIRPELANDPEFIRRFEAEAQIIARLEHPRIVPLYDYWREPDSAFLVMRLLRGGSLENLLEQGPLTLAQTGELLKQLSEALSAAHSLGIVHRDLKPANILLDERGNFYLSDFGIAKQTSQEGQLTRSGAFLGSPQYMSPEQMLNRPVSPQADLYSLGLLMYEVLVGERPFADDSLGRLIDRHLHEPLPSAVEKRPDLPEAVDEVIWRATAKEPAERFPDVLAFAAAFQAALSGVPMPSIRVHPSVEPAALLNPYKGLRAFQEADAEDFFGREALVERLLARLSPSGDAFSTDGKGPESGRFLAIVGPSGSGKSSAVRAGLVPALRKGGLPGSADWFIIDMLPGPHPLEELEAALLRVAVNPPASLLEQLRSDQRGLARAIKRILPGDETTELVLIVDQFEEVFTLVADPSEARGFLDSLCAAVNEPRSRLRLVLTLRADFYDRPLMFPDFSQLVQHHTEAIVPLTISELARAISAPAERVGAALEEDLAAVLAAEVSEQPGGLPLLQYALTELFERREGRVLTQAAYREIGGVTGALGRRAEEIYLSLEPAAQDAARQLFLRLVTLGEGVEDTRRRALRTEIEALVLGQSPAASQAIERPESDSTAQFEKAGAEQAGETMDGSNLAEQQIGPAAMSLAGEPGQPGGQSEPSAMAQSIEAFGRARLLSFDRDPLTRGPTVEVAHEALLREWVRLRGWLDDSREDLRSQRRLGALTQEWLAAGKEASFLLRGARLDQFETWQASTGLAFTGDERAFLQASLAERQARREAEIARQAYEVRLERRSRNFLRGLVAVFAVAAIVAGLLSLFAFNQQRLARQNEAIAGQNAATAVAARGEAEQLASLRLRDAQVNQSLALAAQSRLALQADNLDLSLALAMEANRISDPPGQAQMALSEAAYAPGTIRLITGHQATVGAVVVSPDGRYGLSGDADGVIFLWNLENGSALRRLEGHTGAVYSLAFTPDGRQALSASQDQTILHWDLEKGEVIQKITDYQDEVNTVAVSPDGRLAASGSGRFWRFWNGEPGPSQDNSVRVWDLQSGEEINRFTFFTDPVTYVNFTQDGQRLAIATSSDGFIFLDILTGKVLVRQGEYRAIRGMAVSPDGKTAITAMDFEIAKLDLDTGEAVMLPREQDDIVTGLAISPDGKRGLSGNGLTIIEYDLETLQQIHRFNLSANVVAYHPDGSRALVGSTDGSLRLLTLASGAEIGRLPTGADYIRGAAYDSTGQAVITDDTSSLSRWDLESGEEIWSSTNGTGFWEISLSPDGKMVLTSDISASASLWDANTGELLKSLQSDGSFEGHNNDAPVITVAFDSSGKFGLSGAGAIGTPLIYWELASGKPVWLFDAEDVLGVAVSPDGRTALSAEASGAVNWWSLETGELLRRLEGHTNIVWSVAFVDERTAISASDDGTMILWDLESGTALRRFLGHADGIKKVVLSPDKHLALSASRDGTAILWDVQTGEPLRRYAGHTDQLMTVALSQNGEEALTGGRDKQAIRWRIDADLESFLKWVEGNRYVRALTCDERAAFQIGPFCQQDTTAGEPQGSPEPIQVSGAALLPPLPLPIPTPTEMPPEPAQSVLVGAATLGVNLGTLPTGGGQVWEYAGVTGEQLSVLVTADRPANRIGNPEIQIENGQFDPTLAVYSPDGRLLAGADDLENGVAKDAYLNDITLPETGGYRIEVRSYRDQTGGGYRLVLAEPRPLVFKANAPTTAGLAIHPDGRTALVGIGNDTYASFLLPAADNRIRVVDLKTGELVRQLEGHVNTPSQIAISPDGLQALSADPDGLAILWDLQTGAELRRLDNQGQTFTGIQFLPDGRTALTSSIDATLALWDLTSGEVLQRFEGHEDWVMDFALSKDGKTAVSSSRDNTVRVWNVATGEQVAVYQPFPEGSTNGIAVSSDGEKILVGRDWLFYIPYQRYDAGIAVLDAGTGEILLQLTGHTSLVDSIAFSPDGRYALSGSADQTVRLWDLNTGDELAVFYGHTGKVWNVAFSPDGLTGYSTGFDGAFRVWDLRGYFSDGDS